jgi:hypothetical protein
MNNLIVLAALLIFISATAGNGLPDLNSKEDLKALGTGRIIEKDNSVITGIRLMAVESYWLVYEKDGSTHDQMMETIRRIEFRETKWGSITIRFPSNKPEIVKFCE